MGSDIDRPSGRGPSPDGAPGPERVTTLVAPRRRLWATGFPEACGGSRVVRARRALMSAGELRSLVSGPERVVAWRLVTGTDGPEPVVFPSGELDGRCFVAEDAETAVRMAMEAAVLDRARCLDTLSGGGAQR